jgi:chromosome segregation ATPase
MDSIAATNTKLTDHFRSIAARESALARRRRYSRSLQDLYKARIGALAHYTDELSRAQRLLDASRRSHLERMAADAARIDREAVTSERLLAAGEEEAELVAERRVALSGAMGRLTARTAGFVAAEQELNVQRDELNGRIASIGVSAPKRTPLKISKEIQV